MQPRIITGSAKGQKMKVPKKGTRPMTDRVKSSVFSIIQTIIPDSKVLDLYAGTGALGIECLSRGAKHATFVDNSYNAVKCIKQNLKKTGFSALANVLDMKTEDFIKTHTNTSFNIIFICPPHKIFSEEIVEKSRGLLKKDGVIISEYPSKTEVKKKLEGLERVDSRQYGITSVDFYIHNDL